MAFAPKTWVAGEVITATDLNRMEDGIETLDLASYTGYVTNGATPTVVGPTGWTAARLGTGIIRVTHGFGTTGIDDPNYTVVATPLNVFDGRMTTAHISSWDAAYFTVALLEFDGTTLAAIDAVFFFHLSLLE